MSSTAPTFESRVLGAVLGAAIGDALGHPTEFVSSFEGLAARFPPAGVTGYALYWERDGRRFAPYTDDTQMAEIVLRELVATARDRRTLDESMQAMGAGFAKWSQSPQGGHRAPGGACMRGAQRLGQGVAWREAGGPTDGGCGSVMRAYPFGLAAWDHADAAEHWAVEHSYLTHGDPIALASCAAMAVAMARIVNGTPVSDAIAEMPAVATRHDPKTGMMIERALAEAADGTPPTVTLQRLEGWAAHEAIAAGAYVVERHPDDITAALLEAANTPGDSDSIATIVGALLGAAHGVESIPAGWVADLERSDELAALATTAAEAFAASPLPYTGSPL